MPSLRIIFTKASCMNAEGGVNAGKMFKCPRFCFTTRWYSSTLLRFTLKYEQKFSPVYRWSDLVLCTRPWNFHFHKHIYGPWVHYSRQSISLRDIADMKWDTWHFVCFTWFERKTAHTNSTFGERILLCLKSDLHNIQRSDWKRKTQVRMYNNENSCCLR